MALMRTTSFHLFKEPSPSRTECGSAGRYDTHLYLETAGVELAGIARMQDAYLRSPIPVGNATDLYLLAL